ncbi:MAG: hypothetical protein ACI9SP_004768 [Arenicella sp.]|jgi:hypothetical protein
MSSIQENLVYLEELFTGLSFSWVSQGKLETIDKPLNDRTLKLLDNLYTDCSFLDIDVTKATLPISIISKLSSGDVVSIRITIERHGGIFFGADLDDLLSSHGGTYCTKIPKSGAILITEGWKSWVNTEQKQSIHAYQRVVQFIEFLKNDVANHSDQSEMILFGVEDKLRIPLIYSAKTVEDNAGELLDSLATINSLIEGTNHQREKAHQIKVILFDILKAAPFSQRLDLLIDEISNVAKRFTHNHELFVSGFSFDDSKEMLRKENREYTSELNNVINSIHSRIIGIPLGTVFPAFLIKTSKVDTTEFDTLIFISAFFMTLVIAFSLYGQARLLKKVRKEYAERWRRMKTEIPHLAEDLQDEFNDLEFSYLLNKVLIVVFSLALLLFFMVPLEAYFDINVFGSTVTFIQNLMFWV